MAEKGERAAAVREEVQNLRESASRENLEEKLQEVVKDKPATKSFLEPRPLLIAAGVAVVLALIVLLLASPAFAGIVLVVVFAITWVVLSLRDYEKRRPTKDMDEVAEERDSDPAPYSG